MIKVIDMLTEINRVIRAGFPNAKRVYLERIKALETPCLSIEIVNISHDLFNQYISVKTVTLDIIYISSSNSVYEALEAKEKLEALFCHNLKIGDRYPRVTEIETTLVDQDLHFNITYEFYDVAEHYYVGANNNIIKYDINKTSNNNIYLENEVADEDKVQENLKTEDKKSEDQKQDIFDEVLENNTVYVKNICLTYELK